jgi:hypothetical protein
MKTKNLQIILFLFFLATSCSNSEDGTSTTSKSSSTTTDEDIVLNTSLFSSYSRLSDFELVECTLSDGTVTECYKVSYDNSPEAWELGCPDNEGEVGGLGVWDGTTNPGLRALDDDLWADFATDGYDIINDDGTINVVTVYNGPGVTTKSAASTEDLNAACLEAPLNDLTITYYIPAYPVKTTTKTTTSSTDYWGISLDGFPFAEAPPSAIMNGEVAIPALDACGGHPQPDGPYHWHLVPQVVNNLLDKEGITNVSCTNITQSANTIIGYARDGFPIYGYEESDGSTPTGLDDCNGHTGVTDDFPNGQYHYHVTNTDVPNILPCTYGATVISNDFSSYE